ncbi:MFS transporter [Lysinibacillus sp. NPDC093190]|uniref:MFS transporter n=1 Tax=Lysinibacillus sp. NPDC093190 TaxID=3390575 RepID=UPI003D004A42
MFNYNFKILASAIFFKYMGISLYTVAAMMLVLDLTHNPFYSGVALFAVSLPACFGFLIAPLVSRLNYKKTLIICECIKFIFLTVIICLSLINYNSVVLVIIMMFTIALLSQFTYPIESTLIPIILEKDNIIKGNSIINTIRESLRIVFLGVAGLTVSEIGPTFTFIITAFGFMITSLLYCLFRNININLAEAEERFKLKQITVNYTKDIKEALGYVRNSIIPYIVIGATLANFFAGGMLAALPDFSLTKGGEQFYGYYMMSEAVGMLIGSLISPQFKKIPFGIICISASLLAGVFWISTSFLPSFVSVFMYGTGFMFLAFINIMIFSSIQQQVSVEMVGRIMALISSFASISLPIGSLLGGYIATSIGSQYSIIFGGVGMIIFSMMWTFNLKLRKLPNIEKIKFISN